MLTELSIDQSQKLISLGVDPKLASKCQYVEKIGSGIRGITRIPTPKPIFDLSDVIEALPKEIIVKSYVSDLIITWNSEIKKWVAFYSVNIADSFSNTELIDSLYQLLCWTLTEFKKKENG